MVVIITVISKVVLVNKKKWTVAGEVLASRGERQKDVMDIFQVNHENNENNYKNENTVS